MSDPIIGIDLGTSNSVVAYTDGTGPAKVLADASGYKIHPSVVSFHPNGGVVVGAPAKQRKVIDPRNTIYSVKRLIGRAFTSPEVKTAQQRSPFQIKQGSNQLPLIVTRGGEFAIPEISGIVLDHVRNVASTALKQEIKRAVVTVPASFNDAQRSATATAGAIAGLTVNRVLNEPTAAALAYGNNRDLNEIIAVYDFGGGTFDITILRLADRVYEVLGTAGDSFLGGDDLDERLVDRMVEKFLAENRIDLRSNEVSIMRLRAVAEQTKIELSRRSRAIVRIDEIAYGPKGAPLNLQIEITRDEFVHHVRDIVDRTFPVCREALSLAGISPSQINDVIMVGGTTKMPYIRDQVGQFFGKAPRTDVNPEEAVAVGAALQARALELQLDRAPTSRIAKPAEMEIDSEIETLELEGDTTDTDVAAQKPADAKRGAKPTATKPMPVQAPGTPASRKPDAKAGTSYSMQRGEARELFEDLTPPPHSVPDGAAQPLARLTKPAAPAPVPKQSSGRAGTVVGPLTGQVTPAPRAPSAPIAEPPRGAPGAFDDFEAWTTGTGSQPLDPSVTSTSTKSAPVGTKTQPLPTASRPPPAPAPAPAPVAPTVAPSPATTAKGFPAPQAYPIVTPKEPQAVVMDVTPRGLGIATVAGFCEELIRRNSRIPTETRKMFTTSRDRQDSVRIVVCQGESRRLDNNTVIGDLKLENLPPRPRGETSIEVTFSLDASGILHVKARDAHSGLEQRASLDLVGAVPEQDVEASRERVQQLRR